LISILLKIRLISLSSSCYTFRLLRIEIIIFWKEVDLLNSNKFLVTFVSALPFSSLYFNFSASESASQGCYNACYALNLCSGSLTKTFCKKSVQSALTSNN